MVGWLRWPARHARLTGTWNRSEPLLLPATAAAQWLNAKDIEVARYSPNCQRLTTVWAANSPPRNKGFPYFPEDEFPGSAGFRAPQDGLTSARREPLREVVAWSAEPGCRVISRCREKRAVVAERREYRRFAGIGG